MKNCAYCGRENDDVVTHCRECGTTAFKSDKAATPTELSVPKQRTFVPRELTEEERKQPFVVVDSCLTTEEADLLIGRLVAEGINASIADQALMQTFSWAINTRDYIRVQVPTGDFNAACALLLAESQEELDPDVPSAASEKANVPLDPSMKCLMFLLPAGCVSLIVGAFISRYYIRNGYTRRANEAGTCFLWGLLFWIVFYLAVAMARL